MTQILSLLFAGAIVVGIGLLIQAAVRLSRKQAAERERILAELGLTPCPEEEGTILETVEWLENNAEYTYSVSDVRKRSDGDAPVYMYKKRRARSGKNTAITDEFLVPCRRPSADGAVFFIKPDEMGEGFATRMARTVITKQWDMHPDDLVKLDLPADITGSNLLGVLGPPGAGLFDLVTPDQLAVILRAGNAGILQLRFRGDWCSFDRGASTASWKLDTVAAFVQQLMGA